jgi:outer membrane protein OmpA-like peptidoglycan-associated protein
VTSPKVVHPKPAPRAASIVLYYASNSWALSSTSKHLLNVLAHEIKVRHLTTVSIDGYASSSGTAVANEAVSANRAHLAASFLEGLLASLHVRGVAFHVAAFGASAYVVRPFDSSMNRRTSIVAK